MKTGDTITAIASPPGRSARGIVRVSGPDAFSNVNRITAERSGSSAPLERGIRAMRLRIDDLEWPSLVAFFPAPKSYTGEHTVEIITVGNPHLLNRIVNALFEQGARSAEPGEFTARAYFNGRMTLAQAEGVAATIAAASDAQLRAAQLLTGGALGHICRSLSEQLARSHALVEAGIDFVDQEDVVPISNAELHDSLRSIVKDIDGLLRHATGMEQLSATPRVVLVGPPNAGKSTLFNTLLERERAVVTDVSGTTRDVLAEPVHLDPDDPFSPEILLTDIAGLDEDENGLNPLMQHAAQRAIEDADLIVYLHPADQRTGAHAQVEAIYRNIFERLERAGSVVHVQSKCDCAAGGSPAFPSIDLAISATQRVHLDELRALIAERLADRTSSLSSDAIALEARHESALTSAREQIEDVCGLISADVGLDPDGFVQDVELTAVRLRLALDALGRITGEVTPDDVLGHIFATFCVGK